MVSRVLMSLAAAVLSGVAMSSLAAEALTSNIPPFSIEQGPRVGFMREIVSEISRRSGTEMTVVRSRPSACATGRRWSRTSRDAATPTS